MQSRKTNNQRVTGEDYILALYVYIDGNFAHRFEIVAHGYDATDAIYRKASQIASLIYQTSQQEVSWDSQWFGQDEDQAFALRITGASNTYGETVNLWLSEANTAADVL